MTFISQYTFALLSLISILWLSTEMDKVTEFLVVFDYQQDYFLVLKSAHNFGLSLSFLEEYSGWMLNIIPLISIIVIGLLETTSRVGALGKWLALVGGIANFGDRLYHGYVVDYLWVGIGGYKFPFVFNVADVLITVGAFLLIFSILFQKD